MKAVATFLVSFMCSRRQPDNTVKNMVLMVLTSKIEISSTSTLKENNSAKPYGDISLYQFYAGVPTRKRAGTIHLA